MNGLRDVTGTAFIVAEFRVRENAEAHPLYVDPIAPIFLDERTKQAADAIAAGFRGGRLEFVLDRRIPSRTDMVAAQAPV